MPGFGATRWAAGLAGGAGLVGLAAGAVLAAGSLGPACANLPDIQQGQCGNGIVEQNEDCDGIGVALDGGPSASGNACSAACQVLCNAPPDGGADAGAGPACPWGWGCGTDGVCRRPAGTFTATAIQINEGVEHLLLGDVNGDGKKEIVVDTGAQLDVHYVDRDDTVEQTISLTVAQPTPAVGDFDGDGIDDIAYRLDSSFAVRRGSRDQTLPALPFAIDLPGPTAHNVDLSITVDVRMIAVDVPAISAGDFKLKELLRLNEHTVTTFLPSTGTPLDPMALLAPAGWKDLAPNASVPVGYWDESAGCEQFFLANTTTNKLEVYYTCLKGGAGWNVLATGPVITPVDLPTGPGPSLVPAGPAWNLDVDGDGHRDLVVYATDGQGLQGQILVAYGDGTGRFGSTPPKLPGWMPDHATSTLLCLGAASYGGQLDPTTCGKPLALADFNGDGVLDVVSPCGIFLTKVSGPAVCTPKSTQLTAVASSQGGVAGALWTAASVADLNGDGVPDVVAASCLDTSITYLENAGSFTLPDGSRSTYFNPFVIPTVGGIDELAVGDFDGDLVPDLMYAERSGSSLVCNPSTYAPAATASLAAVFGGRTGGPEGPVLVAQDVGAVNQIAAHNLNSTIGQNTETIDLALLLTDPADTTHELLYVYQGSTDREIVAPYFMVDPMSQVIDTPLLISMGNFEGNPGTGVAVLAVERPAPASAVSSSGSSSSGSTKPFANLWALHQANGSLEGQPPTTVTVPVPDDGDPGQYLQYEGNYGAWSTSVDLGGQAGDEVVGVTLDRSGALSLLYVFTLVNGTLTLSASGPQKLAAAYGGPLRPADVDADGKKDLILVSAKGALVLWNDGSGALDPTRGTAIPLSQLQAALGSDGKSCGYPMSVVAVTSIQSAVGKPLGVLLATDTGGYLASLDPAAPSGHAFTVTCGTGVPGVPAHTLLVAGDVDGDGVDDVVVGAPGALQIFHGAPVNP